MWKDSGTDDNPASQAARAMLDTFTSAGADHFDITWTNRHGDRAGFRRHMPADTLRHLLPVMLSNAEKNERNLIVRPLSDRAVFIQLDDLSREGLERVKPAAFLGLETSPGNYQAWVSIPAGQSDKDFARRLRKGAGADDTASGATRVAGSRNFKDKYAPDFPTVQIAYSAPGLTAGIRSSRITSTWPISPRFSRAKAIRRRKEIELPVIEHERQQVEVEAFVVHGQDSGFAVHTGRGERQWCEGVLLILNLLPSTRHDVCGGENKAGNKSGILHFGDNHSLRDLW